MSAVVRNVKREVYEPRPMLACDGPCGTEVPDNSEQASEMAVYLAPKQPARHFCPRCQRNISFPVAGSAFGVAP